MLKEMELALRCNAQTTFLSMRITAYFSLRHFC
jgi:hypothetical protein